MHFLKLFAVGMRNGTLRLYSRYASPNIFGKNTPSSRITRTIFITVQKGKAIRSVLEALATTRKRWKQASQMTPGCRTSA
jgi:hypothetical protein